MRYSTQIKPISYIKSHSAEVLDQLTEEREPIIVTQNGEARAVLIDVRTYEQSEEAMALLQILALGEKQVQAGEVYPLEDVAGQLRDRLARTATSATGPAKP